MKPLVGILAAIALNSCGAPCTISGEFHGSSTFDPAASVGNCPGGNATIALNFNAQEGLIPTGDLSGWSCTNTPYACHATSTCTPPAGMARPTSIMFSLSSAVLAGGQLSLTGKAESNNLVAGCTTAVYKLILTN